ncbi:endonuclease domain-containing protein [Homoserinibacter sp. YIM 151385]|uniref:endonuclease domain-containing protein n=1 Tax=Homoserinibacter sp. YIM 151385 TaxID=2985506 RepID=UPI0022F01A83|nr:DUF559 domain-containing protein [Homoserinibacter sp. YIM 151385]WBU38131.1 DUF559 domain-containing protein [Homoserinibacter sp. YIM 151385]
MDAATAIERLGGLAPTWRLLRLGLTSHRLSNAVRSHAIVRVRQGWYALPAEESPRRRAFRVGGQLSCATALVLHGVPLRPDALLHVGVTETSSRLRSPDDRRARLPRERPVHVHWTGPRRGARDLADPETALADLIACRAPEQAVAAADAALRARVVSRESWDRIAAGLPLRLRTLMLDVEPRCESYLESIFRFRLRRLGYHPRVQVPIPGVGRVDVVLGTRVVIELDGWEHHASRESFEEDRRRDAELVRRGYIPLRFTYRSVTRHWHRVLAAIRGALGRGA